MLRCPSTSQTITAFLLLCSCLQLKFPTMTSSSFQTSRLKTVSKRPYVALLPCVGVHAFVCVNFCDTFFLSFFFFTRLGCLCSFSGRASAAAALVIVPVFFFFYVSLNTLTFARTDALWRAAAVLQVRRWVGGFGGVGGLSVSPYPSLPAFCRSCASHHHWDIIALWFICMNVKILWQIFFFFTGDIFNSGSQLMAVFENYFLEQNRTPTWPFLEVLFVSTIQCG